MARITCCKDCTERHPNCHAECEKYKAQKNAKENKPNDGIYYGYTRNLHSKIKHNQHTQKRR